MVFDENSSQEQFKLLKQDAALIGQEWQDLVQNHSRSGLQLCCTRRPDPATCFYLGGRVTHTSWWTKQHPPEAWDSACHWLQFTTASSIITAKQISVGLLFKCTLLSFLSAFCQTPKKDMISGLLEILLALHLLLQVILCVAMCVCQCRLKYRTKAVHMCFNLKTHVNDICLHCKYISVCVCVRVWVCAHSLVGAPGVEESL